MIFSHRYRRALANGRLTVDLDQEFRTKLWAQLRAHDDAVGVQRDPNDRWIDNSSVLAEAADELALEHGWDTLPNAPSQDGSEHYYGKQRQLVLTETAPVVFDFVELAFKWMEDRTKATFKAKLNGLFDLLACPWRFTDGEFFKLDADFMGARLVDDAHGALANNRFDGAAHEFAKARQEAASGEAKDAILYAAKSFESVLKVLTGLEHSNADALIKAFISQGFLDDLPQAARASFGEQVLKTLPSVRNRLAGHGQGQSIIEVPRLYADLSVQLAAAFHNFLIAKHLQRQPPPPQPEPALAASNLADLDDEIPF